MKRLRIQLAIFVMAACIGLFGMTASAASPDDSIWKGLWSGSNFDLFGSERKSTPPKSTPSTTTAKLKYAALGDSVAAGVGLPAARASTSDTNVQCGRSSQAYPKYVARQQSYRLVFAACSGAMAGDLVTKQAVPGPNITAQLDTAFATGRPDIITITAGANDVHWEEFIETCRRTNCNTTMATLAFDSLVLKYKTVARAASASIYLRSNGTPPQVLITGYYQLGNAACLASIDPANITPDEVAWFIAQTDKLNAAIAEVASETTYTKYVPLDFTGRGICSSRERRYVQNLGDAAPFHPTARGQAAIARAISANL